MLIFKVWSQATAQAPTDLYGDQWSTVTGRCTRTISANSTRLHCSLWGPSFKNRRSSRRQLRVETLGVELAHSYKYSAKWPIDTTCLHVDSCSGDKVRVPRYACWSFETQGKVWVSICTIDMWPLVWLQTRQKNAITRPFQVLFLDLWIVKWSNHQPGPLSGKLWLLKWTSWLSQAIANINSKYMIMSHKYYVRSLITKADIVAEPYMLRRGPHQDRSLGCFGFACYLSSTKPEVRSEKRPSHVHTVAQRFSKKKRIHFGANKELFHARADLPEYKNLRPLVPQQRSNQEKNGKLFKEQETIRASNKSKTDLNTAAAVAAVVHAVVP